MKLYYDTGNSATYPQHATEPSWTRISAIISFPKVKSRMDDTGVIVVELGDYEGALKDIWDSREWTRMKLEDEAGNVIFLGYLTGKTYGANQMVMIISDISVAFQWFPMDKNYILAEGYIDDIAFGADTTRLDLVQGNDDRDDFAWAADKWVTERDTAIMVRDNSTGNTIETWLVTGIGQAGGEDVNDAANWEDAADGVYYRACEINEDVFDCIVTPVLGGDNIPNTNSISKIKVFYDFRITWIDFCQGQVWMQANRDGTWYDIAGASGGNEWFGTTGTRVEGSYELIGADLTDYLTLDGANWDEMLGIRFLFGGDHRAGLGRMNLNIDYIKVEITYNADNITPISETLTGNDLSHIHVAGVNWEEMGITDGGAEDGDIFVIGENCKQIVDDIGVACHVQILQLTASTKYMAQHFKGNYGLQILKKVCLLEGWHWWVDFTDGVFGTILVGHLDDLVDSGIDLTQADYDHNWTFDDDSNYFSKVTVYGNAAYRIQQTVTSGTVESPKTKTFYEETITTNAEALAIATKQLAEWSVKHPSIKLVLKGVNAAIKVGTTITLTMVRPTVAEADYPIRMIERERLGHGGIKTTIYAGMGHTTAGEKIADRINAIMYLAQKAHADRLITTPPGVGLTGISWGDIADATGAVEAIVFTHDLDDITKHAALEDITTFNADAGKHGFMPKLSANANQFLDGSSTWRTPTYVTDYYTQAQVDTAVATKDTKEEAHAYVEATALTLTEDLTMSGNNIVMAGAETVDTVNLSVFKATYDAHKHDGHTLEPDAITSDGGADFVISSGDKIVLKPDGDGDDFFHFTTLDHVPYLVAIGGNGKIGNVADPTNDQDVAIKKYHDDNKTVAGDLNHDGIANPNGNAEEQHMTAAQIGALHAIVTVNAPIVLTAQDIEIKNDANNQITEIDTGALSELDTTIPTSKTVFDAVAAANAFGIGNKRTINLQVKGSQADQYVNYGLGIRNVNATDIGFAMEISLPFIKDGKNLIITRTFVGIAAANGTNFITRMRWQVWNDYNSQSTLLDNTTDYNSAQLVTWDHTDITVGNYDNTVIFIQGTVANALALNISFVKIEYYYA